MDPEVVEYLKSIASATPETSLSGQWNFAIGQGGVALPRTFFNGMDLERVKEVLVTLLIIKPEDENKNS